MNVRKGMNRLGIVGGFVAAVTLLIAVLAGGPRELDLGRLFVSCAVLWGVVWLVFLGVAWAIDGFLLHDLGAADVPILAFKLTHCRVTGSDSPKMSHYRVTGGDSFWVVGHRNLARGLPDRSGTALCRRLNSGRRRHGSRAPGWQNGGLT